MGCLARSALGLLCAILTRESRLMGLPPILPLPRALFGTRAPIRAPAGQAGAGLLGGVHRLCGAHRVGHQQVGRAMDTGEEEEEKEGG